MNQREVRDRLEELGVKPSKALGQNFLHDANLVRWMVERMAVVPGERVLEVGPGLGALTGELLLRGVKVKALERDPRLAEALAGRHGGEALEVECVDAARYDVRRLFPAGGWKFAGNLPYSAAAPILFRFAGACSPVNPLFIMVQAEMADRMTAEPGSADYGVMSVLLQRLWRVETLKRVGPRVFHPQPNVGSAILRMERRGPGEISPCEDRAFMEIVKTGFSQRRKQLGKLLRGWTGDWALVARTVGIREQARAEDLSVAEWVRLVNLLAGWSDAPAQDVEGERFDVVDADDCVIGRKSRDAVHVNNLRHRAVHILVVNKAGEIFLQKRSSLKDRHPGCWDSSTAGHVDAGETYDAAAARELREELGLEVDLTPVGRIEAGERTGWEFVHVYLAESDGPFRMPPAEIETGCFFPEPILRQWIASRPEDFSPGFLECFRVARGE